MRVSCAIGRPALSPAPDPQLVLTENPRKTTTDCPCRSLQQRLKKLYTHKYMLLELRLGRAPKTQRPRALSLNLLGLEVGHSIRILRLDLRVLGLIRQAQRMQAEAGEAGEEAHGLESLE